MIGAFCEFSELRKTEITHVRKAIIVTVQPRYPNGKKNYTKICVQRVKLPLS